MIFTELYKKIEIIIKYCNKYNRPFLYLYLLQNDEYFIDSPRL